MDLYGSIGAGGTLKGSSEYLPLDPNQRQSINFMNVPPASKPSFAPQGNTYLDNLKNLGAGDVRLETESAVDTMDFVNKIVGNKKPSEAAK